MSELDKRRSEIFNQIKSFFSTEKTSTSGENVLENRKTKILNALKHGNRNLFAFLGLIPLLIISIYVRTRNLPLLAGKYLVELDSYFWYRYANIIYEQGVLPAIDYMRYAPVGYPTDKFVFFPKTLVYLYKMAHAFAPHLTQFQWHIYFPPIITAFAFIIFFLFVRTMFGNKTALISTAFFTVIPAYIQRTSAGFGDHEAMAMFWMFLSLWFFAMMWKSNKIYFAAPLGAISGIFAGFMLMTWGGYSLLFIVIGLFYAMAYLSFKLRNEQIFGYTLFVALALLFLYKYNSTLALSYQNGTLIMVVMMLTSWLYLAISKTKIKSQKLPLQLAVLFAGLGLTAIITQLSGMINWLGILKDLNTPVSAGRFGSTVAESQIPSFQMWWSTFHWTLVFGFIALIISAILLYNSQSIESKNSRKWILAVIGISALFITIFYMASSNRSGFFSNTFFDWFFLICGLFILISLLKQKTENAMLDGENWKYLFLLVLLLVSFSVSRGQIRLFFALVPAIALSLGFVFSKCIDWSAKIKKYRALILIGVIITSSLLFYSNYHGAIENNKYMGSMLPGQWENAMTFLREQTPPGSVVTHWWDYGHMTIAIGERPSVTDGGNVRSWNHNSGRYFLTGKDSESTLSYLISHNVSYVLISKEEISKYHAFSYIGSDENLDRYSSVGMFSLQDQREVRNGTMLAYGGGWPFDKDYRLGNIVLPSGGAQIYGFTLTLQNNMIDTPKALVTYGGGQYSFDIGCIYVNGNRIDFPTTNNALTGCLVIIPYFQSETQGSNLGAAFWVSEKVWDTNFARLYLYNEKIPYFEEAYNDGTPLGLYQGQLIGPIRIWKVTYPQNIKPMLTGDDFYAPNKYG